MTFDSLENELFPNSGIKQVEIQVLTDFWQEIKSEFEKNDWEEEEGVRFILAAGLASIQNERLREQIKKETSDSYLEFQRLQDERMHAYGRYAVMKYRCYQFMQASKTLEMQLNVCRVQVEGLRKVNEQLRARLDEKLDL